MPPKKDYEDELDKLTDVECDITSLRAKKADIEYGIISRLCKDGDVRCLKLDRPALERRLKYDKRGRDRPGPPKALA